MRKQWFFALLLAALWLTGCSGKTTIEDSCLVGEWRLSNDRTFAPALLPAGAFAPEELTFLGADGEITYTLGKDGRLTVLANNWQARYAVNSGGVTMALELFLHGKVEAEFSVQGSQLVLGALRSSQIRFMADLDGVAMLDSEKPDEFLPLFVPPYTSAQYECQASLLRLSFTGWPTVREVIQFRKK